MASLFFSKISTAVVLAVSVLSASAYDNSRNDNIAVYWGQNSYGATHSDTAGWQKSLAQYCQDTSIDAIPLAFLHVFFSTGGLPEINMANTCNGADNGVFAGTSLANCQSLADDIRTCQAAGKIVTLSLGGATGAASFTSDAQAEAFATTVWNLFLGGSSSTRPFGTAVLDGVDLDIEGGGGTTFIAFVNKLKTLTNGASKKYFYTAAPQCVYPDAYLGAVLNAVEFDAVYVQFYNNWCGLQNYANTNAWNFNQWDTWAKTVSPNRNVKIYIGAPAAPTAAGGGYVDAATLSSIALATRSQYSSFGGVMFWDASQAFANGRIDTTLKNALRNGGGSTPTTSNTPTTSATTRTTTSSTTTGGGEGCGGVSAWVATLAYVGGSRVTYNGHVWTASWWTYGDTPGGVAGVWVDNGACFAKATSAATLTDSRHVVDKAKTLNVVTATGVPTAESTESTEEKTEKKRTIRYSSGW